MAHGGLVSLIIICICVLAVYTHSFEYFSNGVLVQRYVDWRPIKIPWSTHLKIKSAQENVLKL